MSTLAITCDLFRNESLGISSVKDNALWIFGLLRMSARPMFDDVKLVLPTSDGGQFDTSDLAFRLGLPPTPESWARLTGDAELEKEIFAAMAPHFENCSCVFGFGLAPSQMRFFDVADIPFIDVELSQIRCLRKIHFRARTNHSGVAAALASIAVNPQDYIAEAQVMLSGSFRRIESSTLRRGVFFGQSHLDLALVQNGVLMTPNDPDILQRVAEAAEDLDELHVVPHPSSVDRVGHLLPLLKLVPNALLSSEKSYSLMGRIGIAQALSLSSGTLVEAELLGLESLALILPDRDNPAMLPTSLCPWVDVTDDLFSSNTLAALTGVPASVSPRPAGIIAAALGENRNNLAEVPDPTPIPTLRSNAQYSLSSDSPFTSLLQFGWSNPEVWGTWSVGGVAVLAFRLQSPGNNSLELAGQVFSMQSGEFDYQPKIELIANTGSAVMSIPLTMTENRWTARIMLADHDPSQLIVLTFRVSGASAPSSFGVSEDQRKLGVGLETIEVAKQETKSSGTQIQNAKYYAQVHSNNLGYLNNNWLIPFTKKLLEQGFQRVTECGTGNGEFADCLSSSVKSYVALDWAPSPKFPFSNSGVRHLRWDAYNDKIPEGDLICSADFLEHLREAELDRVLGNIIGAGEKQFHVVACYDDFHSHLTIENPEWWLARVQKVAESQGDTINEWHLLDWSHRDAMRPVAVISNIDFRNGSPNNSIK